jgi:hypothetical protein
MEVRESYECGDKRERPLVREARPLQIAPEFAQASVDVLRN